MPLFFKTIGCFYTVKKRTGTFIPEMLQYFGKDKDDFTDYQDRTCYKKGYPESGQPLEG